MDGISSKLFDARESETARGCKDTKTLHKLGAASAPETLLFNIYRHIFGHNGPGRVCRLFKIGAINPPTHRLVYGGVSRDVIDEQRRIANIRLTPRHDEFARGLGALQLARQGNMARV